MRRFSMRRCKRMGCGVLTLCLLAGLCKAGVHWIPRLRALTVGGTQDPNAKPTALPSALPYNTVTGSDGLMDDWLLYQWADGAGAQLDAEGTAFETVRTAEHPLLLHWESERSKAMWMNQPYPAVRAARDGQILETQYGIQNGTQFVSLANGGQVRNCTHWSNAELLAESKHLPELPLKLDGTPMVLLYHTHTTESFVQTERSQFDASFHFRTTEPDKNMVMVGDAIAMALTTAGIGVVHAEELHDFPVWNGSYQRSAATVQAVLKQYPSICVALDIHRDAISNASTIFAPVATINGKQAAQIMIISGCDDGTMNLPNDRYNFRLASQLQQQMEQQFAGLTRPILFDYRKYNQDLTNGSLLIEVGTQGNTMAEARYAGTLFGEALVQVLQRLAGGS